MGNICISKQVWTEELSTENEEIIPPFEDPNDGKPPHIYNKCDLEFEGVVGERATFSMGMIFWSAEALLGALPGVIRTRVGMTGGKQLNPDTDDIKDHLQVVDLEFNPNETTFENLCEYFLKNHDPTICHAKEFRSKIFYHSEEQKEKAIEILNKEKQLRNKRVYTKLSPINKFYLASHGHQKYVLQCFPVLQKALNILGPEDLVYSHLACKVNSILSGCVTTAEMEALLPDLKLADRFMVHIRKVNTVNQAVIFNCDLPGHREKIQM